MSRVAKSPISMPRGVQLGIDGQRISVSGPKGQLEMTLNRKVTLDQRNGVVTVEPKQEDSESWMMAGTVRALVNNMVVGVTSGFQRKLELVGVGYRAQTQGRTLNLSLGFSHPIDFAIPEGIHIVTPTQAEIVVSGADKQQVGQVAAVIRGLRPPEPYKGKGIRFAGEAIVRKETKKTKKK